MNDHLTSAPLTAESLAEALAHLRAINALLERLIASPPAGVKAHALPELYLSKHANGNKAGQTCVCELATGRIVGVLAVGMDVPATGNTTCNPRPDAPHGFNRNASHNAGRYVCDCEGWEQEAPSYSDEFSSCGAEPLSAGVKADGRG